MNTVIFAGVPNNLSGERFNKHFEIIVAETRGEIMWSGGKTEFSRGDIAVIPPLVRHSLRGGGLHVLIDKALLPFKEPLVFHDDSAGGVAHAAKQAQNYLSSDRGELVAEALGGLIVAYVSAFSGADRLSPVVAAVQSEIDKNLSDATFSLEDAIKKLPLNYDYVRKLFKKETGVTPHEYLLDSRMKLARGIICGGMANQYSNYSVSQIAEACGFSEPLYFSRVFKKYYGKSPSAFAEEQK